MRNVEIIGIVAGAFLLVPSVPVSAQQANSAAAARSAFRTASALLASGDTASATDSVLAGVRSWPRQGGYLVGAARLAARAGRSGPALDLLTRASAMGFAWDPSDSALTTLTGEPRFAALAREAMGPMKPLEASTVHLRLADRTLHPEGVAWDAGTGRLFVSSVRHAKVIVISADGEVNDFATAEVGLEATFGMVVDPARGMVWVATSRTPEQAQPTSTDGSGAAVVGLDLHDGHVREWWRVADTTAPHLIGDVTLAPDGSIWATDSRTPALYRVIPDGRGGRLLPEPIHSADWASLQGLAFSPDGSLAWLADWTTGLFRIDVADRSVSAVGADLNDMILGIDGLYAIGPDRLVALQNGIGPPRVIELQLARDGREVSKLTVLDRHLPLAEEPTLGTIVRGALVYVANSPWAYYHDGAPDPARPAPAPLLLRLPLNL